jgi:hypothetical protein
LHYQATSHINRARNTTPPVDRLKLVTNDSREARGFQKLAQRSKKASKLRKNRNEERNQLTAQIPKFHKTGLFFNKHKSKFQADNSQRFDNFGNSTAPNFYPKSSKTENNPNPLTFQYT